MAHIVAVEQEGVYAALVELALDQIGDRRLPRAGEAGEPEHRRLVAIQLFVVGAGDQRGVAVDVGRAAQAEVDHAGFTVAFE